MLHFLRFLFSKTFLVNAVIALVLILSALYATLSYLDDYTLHGQIIKVPDLTGKTLEEVSEILDTSIFVPVIADSIYLREMPPGEIVEQDPAAGKTVKQGRKIYLTLASENAPKISMPNLIDLSLRQASSLMEAYGLVVGELTYKPDLCKNCILGQTYNGEDVEEGFKISRESKIDLIIGMGLSNELTPVPYLIKMKKEMAEVLLKSAYLNIGGLSYDQNSVFTAEDSAAAVIYRQSPFYSEDPIVPMGSSVDLFLTLDTNRIVHSVNPADSL